MSTIGRWLKHLETIANHDIATVEFSPNYRRNWVFEGSFTYKDKEYTLPTHPVTINRKPEQRVYLNSFKKIERKWASINISFELSQFGLYRSFCRMLNDLSADGSRFSDVVGKGKLSLLTPESNIVDEYRFDKFILNCITIDYINMAFQSLPVVIKLTPIIASHGF